MYGVNLFWLPIESQATAHGTYAEVYWMQLDRQQRPSKGQSGSRPQRPVVSGGPMAAMGLAPAIGAEIILNGSLLETRLRTLEPI